MAHLRFIALACLLPVLLACAQVRPAYAGKPSFEGDWSVRWCDKAAPDADCGGFSVYLSQLGERVCGSYDGARVRLAQVDEGGPRAVVGSAVGDTAVLTIRSARSGDLYLVRATLRGDRLHWRMVETIQDVEGDIDIIALDDTLTRNAMAAAPSERRRQAVEACASTQRAR